MTVQPSIADQLERPIACNGLLECLHGLKSLDRDCYHVLAESDTPLTIDEVADRVDRERSTTYRSIQRLLGRGLLEKEQVSYEQGGYQHAYFLTNSSQTVSDMRHLLNDWYAEMGQLIQESEDTYDHVEDPLSDIES